MDFQVILEAINEFGAQAGALLGGSALIGVGRYIKTKGFPNLINSNKTTTEKAIKELKNEVKAEIIAEFKPTLDLMREKTAVDLEANIKNPTVSPELTAKYKKVSERLF